MKCSKCKYELNEGAYYCGNCGYPVNQNQQSLPQQKTVPQPISQNNPNLVSKSITPAPKPLGGKKATAALIFGLLGLVLWILPPLGVLNGFLAIIFGTQTLNSDKKRYALVGLIVGGISMLVSIMLIGGSIIPG